MFDPRYDLTVEGLHKAVFSQRSKTEPAVSLNLLVERMRGLISGLRSATLTDEDRESIQRCVKNPILMDFVRLCYRETLQEALIGDDDALYRAKNMTYCLRRFEAHSLQLLPEIVDVLMQVHHRIKTSGKTETVGCSTDHVHENVDPRHEAVARYVYYLLHYQLLELQENVSSAVLLDTEHSATLYKLVSEWKEWEHAPGVPPLLPFYLVQLYCYDEKETALPLLQEIYTHHKIMLDFDRASKPAKGRSISAPHWEIKHLFDKVFLALEDREQAAFAVALELPEESTSGFFEIALISWMSSYTNYPVTLLSGDTVGLGEEDPYTFSATGHPEITSDRSARRILKAISRLHERTVKDDYDNAKKTKEWAVKVADAIVNKFLLQESWQLSLLHQEDLSAHHGNVRDTTLYNVIVTLEKVGRMRDVEYLMLCTKRNGVFPAGITEAASSAIKNILRRNGINIQGDL